MLLNLLVSKKNLLSRLYSYESNTSTDRTRCSPSYRCSHYGRRKYQHPLKWLVQSFRDLRVAIDNLSRYSQKMLDDHEEKDQLRHEQNLVRFEQIAVVLAGLGLKHGK